MNIPADAQIENKLLATEEFIKLDQLLNRFNIFEATDMGRREIKHTKFLAYLLDPNESHGLGEAFLRVFATQISSQAKLTNKFPKILDLQLSYATVYSEFSIKNNEPKNKSLDCLIRIPYINQRDEDPGLIIAIENKLGAKENKNQTKEYSEGLRKKFPKSPHIVKLFLTVDEEEPELSCPEWMHITYGNDILPIIGGMIESIKNNVNRSSIHMLNTLIDYQSLLLDDQEGRDVADSYASKITKDVELKNYVTEVVKQVETARKPIYVKYKKAIDYLNKFDDDPRHDVLKWWNSFPEKKLVKLGTEGESNESIHFYRQSSGRPWLHFSLLTEKNMTSLEDYADNPDRRWLKSTICPINFVIRIIPTKQGDSFRCSAALILGPIRSPERREEMYKTLWSLINGDKEPPSCNLYWNTLTNKSTGRGPKIQKQPKDWIQKEALNLNDGEIILNDWAKDLAQKINKRLTDFFNEKNI
jgi:hypothetical protein